MGMVDDSSVSAKLQIDQPVYKLAAINSGEIIALCDSNHSVLRLAIDENAQIIVKSQASLNQIGLLLTLL